MPPAKITDKLQSWVKIARLPFYPMTWIAYSLGAAAAAKAHPPFVLRVYLLGYLALFVLEFATILANEYFDYETDRRNQNGGPFTGGTRILVEGKLAFPEVRTAIALSLALLAGAGFLLAVMAERSSPLTIGAMLLLGVLLGLGYTAPPLKLSYRGLGEMTVGLTHSFYVIVCGYVFQGGSWSDALPWLLSVPLFFAVLAANTLAGIPDRLADQQTSKNSFAVLCGPRNAGILAACFIVASWAAWAALWQRGTIRHAGGAMAILLAHGLIFLWALSRFIRSENYDRRIDGLMALALSYITWFGLIPLLTLIGS